MLDCGADPLKCLLLEVASCREVSDVLTRITDGLARIDAVALARIWLVSAGDICPSCPMRDECADRSSCLHLVASAGASRVDGTPWTDTGGAFRRIPLGVRKVGRIGATATAVDVEDVRADGQWIARPEWAEAEGIIGFGGQPLVHLGETLGVLAVFFRVPLDPDTLVWLRMLADHAAAAIATARAFEEIERLRYRLEQENRYLREEVNTIAAFGEIVGGSTALQKALAQIELVAPTDAGVLITGESGTGKELVARAVHERSKRSDAPLVKVNCASIPRDLFESEMFGHTEGAFTGAIRDRVGRFELADGGTLFLDEVGEIPVELQSKLLRVLQEGTYERVGDASTRTADVRIVAATNRDLRDEVAAGRFRQDLYYRLTVVPIEVPPLRDRLEDVPHLAAHFLDESAKRLGLPTPELRRRHVMELQRHDWPGNVRELRNVIERAVILSRGGPLRLDLGPASATSSRTTAAAGDDAVLTYNQLRDHERQNVVRALESADWRVSGPDGAAALLDIKPTTLSSRMKAMGVARPR